MVKGCWVCGANHQARRFHTEEEVMSALKKHMEEGNYLDDEEVYDGVQGLTTDLEDESDAGADESEEDTGMIAEEVYEVNSRLERRLANKSFVHTCGFSRDRNTRMNAMNRALRDDKTQQEFKGVMIDTGSNRSSVISLRQYRAYVENSMFRRQLIRATRERFGLLADVLVPLVPH